MDGSDYTTADILNRLAVPDPLSDPRGYISDYLRRSGRNPSPELAQALDTQPAATQPNILSRAMESVPPEAMFAANFLAPNVRLPVPRVPNPIKAYHGSPHDFDKFDLSKIGTGEGAQAYGHGLYFAENPTVAEAYRAASGVVAANDPVVFSVRHGVDQKAIGYLNAFAARDELGDVPRMLKETADWASMMRQREPIRSKGDFAGTPYAEIEASIRGLRPEDVRTTGRTYEVALHASPEQFLDWDKPLSAQSASVREALERIRPDASRSREANENLPGRLIDKVLRRDPTVADYVNSMRSERPLGVQLKNAHSNIGIDSLDRLPKSLQEANIPGMRYLDQGSRATGQGTSNYVVWSPEIIEILRKYGLLAPTAAPAIAEGYNRLAGEQGQ